MDGSGRTTINGRLCACTAQALTPALFGFLCHLFIRDSPAFIYCYCVTTYASFSSFIGFFRDSCSLPRRSYPSRMVVEGSCGVCSDPSTLTSAPTAPQSIGECARANRMIGYLLKTHRTFEYVVLPRRRLPYINRDYSSRQERMRIATLLGIHLQLSYALLSRTLWYCSIDDSWLIGCLKSAKNAAFIRVHCILRYVRIA